MDDRALSAAANNAEWCDLVCRSHGIPTATRPDSWVALRRTPELYPDVVTLRPGVGAHDALRSTQAGPGRSVKDGFVDLGFGRLGFPRELFEASWIYREPRPPPPGGPMVWTAVRTDAALAAWADAADLADIIRGDLLRQPAVRVLAARADGGLVAGAIAHRTGSVSASATSSRPLPPAPRPGRAWRTRSIASVLPSLPLVGYERGEELEAARAAGFIPIGALRVWV